MKEMCCFLPPQGIIWLVYCSRWDSAQWQMSLLQTYSAYQWKLLLYLLKRLDSEVNSHILFFFLIFILLIHFPTSMGQFCVQHSIYYSFSILYASLPRRLLPSWWIIQLDFSGNQLSQWLSFKIHISASKWQKLK